MKELFSLGELYVSDFLKEGEQPRGPKTELKLMLEEDTGAVRLEKTAPLDTMFGAYWYRSSINSSMREALSDVVNSIMKRVNLKTGNVWIDLAANDGCLLSFLPDWLIKIGIDPADDSFKRESEQHADLIIQDYFTAKSFKESKFGKLRANVITTIAMFYDIDDPKSFINDVKEVLDDDGVWVLQLSYTPLMLKQLAFDNILQEHIYYYSLFNLKKILNDCDMQILDVELNDVNGGSFRIYVMKNNANTTKFGTQPQRDVGQFRVLSLLEYENTLKLDNVDTWKNFHKKIDELKYTTVSFIQSVINDGKTVYGYGSSTKGNTLLQYFGLDNTLITAIAERSPYKFGLRTVGTNIPIISEEEMRKVNPDYLLVLPWHFINEFIKREKKFLDKGGKFIVPCPKFEVIGKE